MRRDTSESVQGNTEVRRGDEPAYSLRLAVERDDLEPCRNATLRESWDAERRIRIAVEALGD